MGRIFEVRKATMFARWDKMAKQFTRIGKEIALAVKSGGPDPNTNAALRRCFQNAKSVNMPKDRVEAAIKRAMGKEMDNMEEILYEGYAPHGWLCWWKQQQIIPHARWLMCVPISIREAETWEPVAV